MLPDIEPPPVWTPLISWSHPRVWLREAAKALSAWLNKPTKAEMADTDAWHAAAVAWSMRVCGECSSDSTQQERPEVPVSSVPAPPQHEG